MNKLKLMKALQAAGLDSRRSLRKLIQEGEFTVNGAKTTDPNLPVDPLQDAILLRGKRLKIKLQPPAYFIFNKPTGVVSTLSDPEYRPTIKHFIGKIKERVYPVGRLDFHSEGLILLTNDGELTNAVISPRNHIPKQYLVKIKGALSEEESERIKTRGALVDGSRLKPLKLETFKKTAQGNSWVNIIIIEGKKHILRKMFQYGGHPVEKLKRVAIGTIKLGKLPSGHWRELTATEVTQFKANYPVAPPGSVKDRPAKKDQLSKIKQTLKKSRPSRGTVQPGRLAAGVKKERQLNQQKKHNSGKNNGRPGGDIQHIREKQAGHRGKQGKENR